MGNFPNFLLIFCHTSHSPNDSRFFSVYLNLHNFDNCEQNCSQIFFALLLKNPHGCRGFSIYYPSKTPMGVVDFLFIILVKPPGCRGFSIYYPSKTPMGVVDFLFIILVKPPWVSWLFYFLAKLSPTIHFNFGRWLYRDLFPVICHLFLR